jgi:SNF2 family DNA or RNA helicase
MLRKYQVEGVSFLLSHRRSVLALAPGVGKTPTTLVALRDASVLRVLIVAPKSVVHHWENLAMAWWPDLWTFIGTGTAKQRTVVREDVWTRGRTAPTALIINYEAMRQDIEALSKIQWDAVVFDEAHRLKNRQAQQTRAANVIAKHPHQWVWLVTGTPILNRPEEIWSLLHLCDQHRFSSYWAWVRSYYETSMESYGWGPQRRAVEQLGDLRDGALDSMRSELGDVMFHRSLEECLPHLPPVTNTLIDVELDPEERKLYEALLHKTWADIEGEILLIPNEVARMTRLRQVVSDVEILGATRTKPGSKIAAALELISDLEPEQVVVLTWSRAAAERVAEECDGAFIHGGVDTGVRQQILGKFVSGEIRILAGTLATLGEGVDGLQVARHLIRLDRDWTPARNDQAVARLRRSGQRSAVVVHDIVAFDTIDATVERALRHKTSVIEAVLKDLGK